ncbi:MAG: type IV pilus assembly protein PilQ [Psychromonas sp.]|jgi:type IV pilus assembly protein PilQ|uniref:AMIN domain-containing protein n=1 Tax=Psychromonas sp. TaxID=1884585 RepID=UPI0039E2ECF3
MNTSYLKKILTLLPLALLFHSSIGFAESQLDKLDINPLAEGKFELRFAFNESISGYQDKLYYRPNKLVIDVEDASSVLALNPIKIDKGGVNNVATERTPEGLRLTINLDTLMPYRVVQENSVLFVRFGNTVQENAVSDKQEDALAAAVVQYSGSQTAKAVPSKINAAIVSSHLATPKGYVNSIHSLDFKRGPEGQGKLLVYLDNSSVAVDIRRRDQQLIVEFQSTYIPDELLYIMDVVDFATTVQKIESFKENGKTRLVFDIKDQYNYRYDQLDTLFMIEISEKPKDQKESAYQGKAISLNFQDIPVRTVLQLIADFNGFNLVITDSVTGNITLRLDDVPWEQALDIILKVKGLGKRLDGNVLMIAPATELAAKERAELESENEVASLATLYSEFIQINYAKATDIVTMLSSDKTSLLSERGSVSMDERTNFLILKDTAAVIDSVKDMLKVLDIPVRQVVIEARMVTVSDSVSEDLGVEWSSSSDDGSSSGFTGTTVNSDGNSIGFQFAKLNGSILDLQISALEAEGKAEVIASPRITTADQQTAYIEQGTEIPYAESSSSGATTISFEKAVLSLKVTPQITPDNKVILDLIITQDSVGETYTASDGAEYVSIDTNEITTQVLVNDGETLVLGGIYQQLMTNTETKVPVLGDIPYLGVLFRQTSSKTEKQELLVFVTPRIVMQTKY